MNETNTQTTKERDYCNFDHIQHIIAYCSRCANYICENCQIESHFNHDMVNLESECFKKFSEYKNIAYNIKVTLKQYHKVLTEQSIDESLSSLTAKINNLFNELIESILAYKEKILKELMESKEIQSVIKERIEVANVSMEILQQLNTDTEKLLSSIQDEFSNKRYILLYERNSQDELKPFKDRLNEWKRMSIMNPLKLQELEQDICIDTKPSEAKLKQFINLNYRSHPYPQKIYDLNEFDNMLLLHNINTDTSSLLKVDSSLRVPSHYSSALLDSKVYFAGGDDDGYRKDCYAISLDYGVLLALEDLHVERRAHALVPFHVQKFLFAVGGYNKAQGILNSVEQYNAEEDEWTVLPQMLNKRQWPGTCQFNSQFLYCFGGFEVETIERINITEETKKWELVVLAKKSEHWVAYSACAAIQINPNEVLIMGGRSIQDSDRAFIYNHRTQTITENTKMPVPSLFCQMVPVVSESRIGIIGWRNDILYIYDTIKDKWNLVDPVNYQTEEFTKQ